MPAVKMHCLATIAADHAHMHGNFQSDEAVLHSLRQLLSCTPSATPSTRQPLPILIVQVCCFQVSAQAGSYAMMPPAAPLGEPLPTTK